MRILFTGGGTGGHIFPIIAIKESFDVSSYAKAASFAEVASATKAESDDKFYYLGPDGFAKENLNNIKSRFILAGKLHRYFSLALPIEITKTIIGIIQSFFYLFLWVPDVIFSKGGYGSFPTAWVARIYKIPIILHDSDAVPGLANKKIAKYAKKIILSFPNSENYFSKYKNKTVLIGNPIRKELLTGNKEKARELFKISSTSTSLGTSKPIVLIIGGSQGAQKINELVSNFLPRLLEISEIIHVSGKINFNETDEQTKDILGSYENLKPYYHLYPFLNQGELKHAYAIADLIINRAGAGSIFEVAALGKPSILIPLPNSAQNHQRKNAYEFSGNGSRAIVLDQENVTPNLLLEQISNLLSNPELMKRMGDSAKSFYNPQTPELIRDEILKFAK